MPWGITNDGVVIEKTPLELARLGKVANVPVIMGITQDEGSHFAMAISSLVRPVFRGDIPANFMRNITIHLLGSEALADSVLEMYMPSDEGLTTRAPESVSTVSIENIVAELAAIRDFDISLLTAEELAAALPSLAAHGPSVRVADFDEKPFLIFTKSLKDSLFTCPTMAFADAVSVANGGRVYTYNFALDVWADTTSRGQLIPNGGNLTLGDLGAFHGSEIPFIWNLFSDKDVMPSETGIANLHAMYTAKNFCPTHSFKRAVANEIGCLWTNMAKCGAPQCEANDCLIDQVWEPHTSDQFLDIHGRGAYRMSSKTETIGKCPLWNGVRIPFLDFRQPVSEKPVLRMDAKAAAPLALSLTAILCMLFI
jgi:carboxylesterase type B